MPTAHIRIGGAMNGGAVVIEPIASGGTETITTSTTSIQTTITAPHQGKTFARIVANGGNICFAVGSNPVAVIGSGDIIMSGASLDLGPLTPGDKIAVINA